MKRSFAIILMVCIFTMAFSGIAFASFLPPPPLPVAHAAHHPSFWMGCGRFIVGAAVVWWIVDSTKHKDKAEETKPATTEPRPDGVVITPSK